MNFPRTSNLASLFKRGPLAIFDEVSNRRLIWSAQKLVPSSTNRSSSSISESMPYVEICKMAVLDERIFNRFKSNKEYREVLEHCDYHEGRKYLSLLRLKSTELNSLKTIARSDIGGPQRFYYPGLGRTSPTQIRYAKILQDLHLLFGDLKDMVVSEIGAGYGGQAIHVLNSNHVKKYIIYDLEWPSKLALKTVLTQFKGIAPIHLGDYLVGEESDLVISNYAFSELTMKIQEVYLEKVILNSKRGYFIYNHIHKNHSDSLTAVEFASKIPGAEIFEEIPLTYKNNVLVVWGHDYLENDNNLFRRIV